MDQGKKGRGGKGPAESLASGLVLGSVFLCVWLFGGHQPWALFAAVFGGAIPVSKGLSGLIAARAERASLEGPRPGRIDPRGEAARAEKAVLLAAKGHGGRVTPSLVALDSDMSVEEAEAALDGLAKKGHASVRVREDGRIEYEFSEFLPQGGSLLP